MSQSKAESTRVSPRVVARAVGAVLAVVVIVTGVLCFYPQAYANFSSESAGQIIGVGRIQSTTVPSSSPEQAVASRFEAPEQLAAEPTEVVSRLAQPLDRSALDTEGAVARINFIQRFGEPDENGWFTTKASAYGPSSAGTHTALGTELTLTSMDVGIHINHIDLIGRYVDLMYGGVVLRCRIVDTGEMAPDGRLFDLQPGVCTAFGAETPEFGWGVRTIKWRLVD
jgi:hypothetical protein